MERSRRAEKEFLGPKHVEQHKRKEGRHIYTGWWDPDKKKRFEDKVRDACARFEEKWGRAATHALVNEHQWTADLSTDALLVEPSQAVSPNCVFAGEREVVVEEALSWRGG